MIEDYGFTVRRHRELDYDDDGPVDVYKVVPGQWCVYLPHQCSSWDIAGESGSYQTVSGESHESAVASLEAFIAQAQTALAALREEREQGGDQP
jgi:hypothetical protein